MSGYLKRKEVQTYGLNLSGAEDETRTRDPDLGKVVLYQLSYFRLFYNALGVQI